MSFRALRSTKALYCAIGPIDIVGAARSALLIARTDKAKPDERVMAVQKCYLAPAGPAVVFSVGDKIERSSLSLASNGFACANSAGQGPPPLWPRSQTQKEWSDLFEKA